MENKLQHDDIEKNLVDQLSNANLNKDQLSSISKSIAALQKSGFQVIDWSMFGKPALERFVIDTQLPLDKANAFQNLFVNKDWKQILIYRKGIPPMPNFYNVKLTIENV